MINFLFHLLLRIALPSFSFRNLERRDIGFCAVRLEKPHRLDVERLRRTPERRGAVVVQAGRNKHRRREFRVPEMFLETNIRIRAGFQQRA